MRLARHATQLAPRLAALVLVGGLALAGCGGAAPHEDTSGLLLSTLGKLRVEVAPDPNPPLRGVNAVTYTITATSGVPVDGLVMTVVPWMPAHGHGTSVKPTVTALGHGTYRIDDVLFFMPGRWELRTTFSGRGDTVAPAFDVP